MDEKYIGDHELTKTHVADENLLHNRFVKLVTNTGPIPHCVYSDAGELGPGVNRDTIDSGKGAEIVYSGTAFVETSENVAANLKVASDADGKAKVADATDNVRGISVSDANSGGFVKVLLVVGPVA